MGKHDEPVHEKELYYYLEWYEVCSFLVPNHRKKGNEFGICKKKVLSSSREKKAKTLIWIKLV